MIKPARRLALAVFLSATAAFGAIAPQVATAQVYSTPTQAKYAAIVVDAASGEVMYARRADSPRYPASITKVMTLYMAFEALEQGKVKLTDQVMISPRAAASAPTKSSLRAGQTIRLDEAMHLMAVRSYNDLAVAVAEHVGGTEQRFTALMTLRAQELGMTNSRFVNAHGLPDSRHISSARDLAILSRAVLRDYPQYFSYFGTKEYAHHGRQLRNTNGLLHAMPGVDGIKTGYTNAAGYNLAASAVRDGRRLIAVVLGGSSTSARNAHTADLLNAGFNVAARRDRGETITLASMFPDSGASSTGTAYAYARPTVQQGDSGAGADAVEAAEDKAIELALAETKVRAKFEAKEAARKKKSEAEAARKTELAIKAEETKAEKAAKGKADKAEKAIELARLDEKKAKKAEPGKAKDTAKKDDAPATESGGWLVQVGAFTSETDAKDRLKQVTKKFGKAFGGRDGKIEKTSSHYRTQFTGFTPADAKAACKALDAKGEPCMAKKA